MLRIIDVGITSDNADLQAPYRDSQKLWCRTSVEVCEDVSGLPSVKVGALIINWRSAYVRKSKILLNGMIFPGYWAILSLTTLQHGAYSYDFW